MRSQPWPTVLLVLVAAMLCCNNGKICSAEAIAETRPAHFVTNLVQFRSLSGADYLLGCNFRLTGVVTLVDTNRDLVVLQDSAGAIALHSRLAEAAVRVGQRVTLEGDNCCPYFAGFPNYPYRPAHRDVSNSFEIPSNPIEYQLTRIRGYLHPPASGEYTFWIASDNSSELWLSVNADDSEARKIASIPRYGWVEPLEWMRYPSQRSDPVSLREGETYYVEAISEQTTGSGHLAVAWQGPGLTQSIIEAPFVSPWGAATPVPNGILREYWTNYPAGDLEGMTGPRPYEAALTVEKVRVSASAPGELPMPASIALDQHLSSDKNYCWVQVEGLVTFAGAEGDMAHFELTDSQGVVQVRVPQGGRELVRRIRGGRIRVEGVCEGVFGPTETLMPGVVWATAETSVTFLELATTNALPSVEQPAASTAVTNPARQGFYATRGVVTFNDRVFGNDYVFVQENAATVLLGIQNRNIKESLKVGRWLDLGGALEPGKYVPVLTPLAVKELGWHSMPPPITQPLAWPTRANREGRWSELEGVARSVNSNATLSLAGKNGLAYLWIGQTPSNSLAHYVDARLRARGVVLVTLLDAPVLLVPSPSFVDVEMPAPADPFGIPKSPIAELFPDDDALLHRVRVAGQVTYRDVQSFFVQDASAGIRVRTAQQPTVHVGQTIEVVAFPAKARAAGTLTEPLIRSAPDIDPVKSRSLNLSTPFSSEQSGSLIHVNATLLAHRTSAAGQVLELQEQQRVFVATLAADRGHLPNLAPGSRLRITGVCDDEMTAIPSVGDKPARAPFLSSLNILLRGPRDVAVLTDPPWWTLQRTSALVGALLVLVLVTALWAHLLRRRLERQQAEQLVFSRQVLERLEDERRRIAVNLHDSLGQTLMVIKNHALLAMQRPPDEPVLQKRLDEISDATSRAIEEVRQITHGLRPYQLDRLGLSQAIRASVGRAAPDESISFATRVEDIDGLFDKDAEIHVYRIVQEAITNVVKHSAATEAAVVIKKRAATVSLVIRDNGRGFDPGKPSAQPHDLGYGLSGMAERVRILGGTLAIDSRPGAGTSLTVEVPLPIREHDTRNNSVDRR